MGKSKSKSKSKSASTSRSAAKDRKKRSKNKKVEKRSDKTETKIDKLVEEKSGEGKSIEAKSKSGQSKIKKRSEPVKSKETEQKEEKKEEKKKDKGSKNEEKSGGNVEVKSGGESPSKSPTITKKSDKEEASVFEEVICPGSPASPAIGKRGIKNKLRWKIDVEPVDVNGDQKMPDVLEKLTKLNKKNKQKDEESAEELIMTSARVLQMVKLDTLIGKELIEADQDILKSYCRSGDQEEKAEALLDKVATAALNAVVTKNDYVRQVTIPGQLRMFAVDDKKAKLPMMALMMARKDLFYASWSKASRETEKEVDATWTNMTAKKEKAA